jgi:hypothetical protein
MESGTELLTLLSSTYNIYSLLYKLSDQMPTRAKNVSSDSGSGSGVRRRGSGSGDPVFTFRLQIIRQLALVASGESHRTHISLRIKSIWLRS